MKSTKRTSTPGPTLSCLLLLLLLAAPLRADLVITSLGRLPEGLTKKDEESGTERKWELVRTHLGLDSRRVVARQSGSQLGGNTSVRSEMPLIWKDKGYYRRARDLGQVFTAPRDFTLDALVLRTGNDRLAFLPGSAGAEVFVQFFRVRGEPVIDDNGTPPGTKATHGFSTNHRCDDFIRGVTYESIRVVEGGKLPDLREEGEGKLTYLKWDLTGEDELRFEAGERYAFMVGFVHPGPERNFTLANLNNASSPKPPVIRGENDGYGGGWALRREGNGARPPLKVPGESPPGDPAIRARLEAESTFPAGAAHYEISPTCDGYPDVDTYRDHEFYLVSREAAPEAPRPVGEVRQLADGFRFTEGPAWHAREQALYFSDIPNRTMHRYTADGGATTIRKGEQASNGIYLDARGRAVFCEVGAFRLVRREADGKETVLVDRVGEQLLGHPNDVWIAPDGGIYFSIPDKSRRIPRLAREGRLMGTLVHLPPGGGPARDAGAALDIGSPNGVVGSSDGLRIYYTDRGRCWQARIGPGGKLSDKKVAAPKGSDGLALDEHLNLYTTSRGKVEVFDGQARKILEIPVAETPANLCFGGPDGRTLFITARQGLYSVPMNVRGDGFVESDGKKQE